MLSVPSGIQARAASAAATAGAGGGRRAHSEAFLTVLLPAAPDVLVQIAHFRGGNQYRAEPLAVYAAAIAAGDPRTRKLYFHLAEIVPGALGSKDALREIAERMR